MTAFTPPDPDWEDRIRDSFARPTIIQHTLHDPSGSNIPGIRFMDGSLPLVAVHLGTGSTF
jgi:hypothetical protein